MDLQIEILLLIFSSLILFSITIAKFSDRIGVPALLLFIIVGMVAGSEGPVGIYFDDAALAQSIGIIALIFILFSGGLDTNWQDVKPIVYPALSLATLGVLLTAILMGIFVSLLFDISFVWGLLLGAIISSTDAAAVFATLRIRNVSLKGKLKPLLELESGSNDPMAVFLTIGCIELLLSPDKGILDIITLFFLQMGIGAALGILTGKSMVFLINKINFSYEGIYPVFAIAMVVAIFSFTSVIGGSGFLAVYLAGLVVGNNSFIHKKGMIRFFEGLGVFAQIAMFLTLGLLVFPSHVLEVVTAGLLISAVLIFVARPISVFISLFPFKFNWKEKVFVSWVGLRGAVPIILATFPLLVGIDNAELIFNVVFFIVLSSALVQGWSLVSFAKMLNVNAPVQAKKNIPIEFNPSSDTDMELIDFIVPYNSTIAARPIVELGFPEDSRIVLIWRNEQSIVPSGGTILDEGDTLLILVNKNNIKAVKNILKQVNL